MKNFNVLKEKLFTTSYAKTNFVRHRFNNLAGKLRDETVYDIHQEVDKLLSRILVLASFITTKFRLALREER
jgi:uncharacterized protein (DUF924 family)